MPDREHIRQTLVEIIENDLGERPQNIADEVNLRQGLGLDSVDVVGIVMQIEGRFRIRLTHAELEKVATVGNLLDLIQTKVAAGPEAAAA
jgi:acyl carrier protein